MLCPLQKILYKRLMTVHFKKTFKNMHTITGDILSDLCLNKDILTEALIEVT